MGKFADLEALVAVVEAGTFNAAGERLGVAKSMVSRRISQMESRLGSRLLHRTTRRLTLTDAGRNFYQRALQILAELDEAEQSVAAETTELRGAIKLAAPLTFGLKHLSGAITDFLDTHPAIELNLDLNDRNINLVEEGFDLAVRIGELQDSTLVARRLGISRAVTCASRAYLDRHGEPAHPDESAAAYRPAVQQHRLPAAVAIRDTGGQDGLRPAADPHPRQQRRGPGLCRRRRSGHHDRSHLHPGQLSQGRQPGQHPE